MEIALVVLFVVASLILNFWLHQRQQERHRKQLEPLQRKLAELERKRP